MPRRDDSGRLSNVNGGGAPLDWPGETCSVCQSGVSVESAIATNVQRETTFPQGMSRRQAALPFR